MNANFQLLVSEDNFQNYGRIQDFMPHVSGVVSMDNPEYILQEAKRRGTGSGGSGNYHTLGIPVIPSPTASSSGPSSLPAPPYASLSSTASSSLNTASNNSGGQTQPQGQATAQTGLNGAVLHPGHPRSSDGESDHEYYNDVDRLKREMQPLQQQQQQLQQQPRNETTV